MVGMDSNKGRKVFIVFNYVFCIFVGLVCVVPIIHILAISLSSANAVFSGHVTFLPVESTWGNYNIVIRDYRFFQSYLITFVRAALGLGISLVLTILAAYPMSLRKVNFPARGFFVYYFLIPMIFSGGMIPTYLVVKELSMLNTLWALLLPCALSTYNLILMMNFMKSLPESLSESAFLDGAGHWITLVRIILPLSMPSIATVSLFIVLHHWNAWFDGSIYIVDQHLKPLQTYLRSTVLTDASIADLAANNSEDAAALMSADGSNAAKIFLAMVPILCVYPFVQKHFVKGVVRGSVKE